MLDLFRKKGFANIIYGVVIVAVLLAFVVNFNPAQSTIRAGKGGGVREICAAKIRGFCVDDREHQTAVSLLMPRDREGRADEAMGRSNKIRKLAMDGLVERELLVGEAERLGINVSEEEVTESIYEGWIHYSVPLSNPTDVGRLQQLGVPPGGQKMDFRNREKKFDEGVYRKKVARLTQRSPEEFRQVQKRELLAGRMREFVQNAVRVSENEAFDSYVAERSSSAIEYMEVKEEFAARYGAQPSDAEVEAWAKVEANAKAVAAVFEGKKEDCLPKAGHIRHILIKVSHDATDEGKGRALGRLSQAAARVRAGEYFGTVAEISEDTGSGARCGDVGDKTDGFVLPFKKAADALKPGETSQAIETQFGFHWIMKDDPAKAGEIEAKLKKAAAREAYRKEKAIDLAKPLAEKLFKDAKAANKPFSETFENAKYASFYGGNASKAVPTLTVVFESSLAADAGPAPKPVVALFPGPDEDDDKPRVDSSQGVNRNGNPISSLGPEDNEKLMKFAFSAKDGEIFPELLKTSNGYVFARLKDRSAATKEQFEKDREPYMESKVRAKRMEALMAFIRRLKESAREDIKIEETFTKELSPDAGAKRSGDDEEY